MTKVESGDVKIKGNNRSYGRGGGSNSGRVYSSNYSGWTSSSYSTSSSALDDRNQDEPGTEKREKKEKRKKLT